ncbi:MAG: serine/threonine protein kinase [Verrucomicrobiota bacterium]
MTGRWKQLAWILPLTIALLVAGLGWWGNGRLRETIEGELHAQLSATLNANVTALGIWTTNQTRLATSLAEDPNVRTLAGQIFQLTPTVRRDFRMQPELEQFVADLKPRLSRLGYEIAQLVNTRFVVVANSQRAQLAGNLLISDAHTNKFAELFASGQPVIITPFKPEMLEQRRSFRNAIRQQRTNDFPRTAMPAGYAAYAGRPRRGDVTLMQVAAPVRNQDNLIVGALALIINPDKEFSRILSVARSGKSGETYAFDQTGLMISHSRFDDQLKRIGLLEPTNSSSALNLRLHDPGGNVTEGFRPADSEPASRPLIRLVADAVDGEDSVLVRPERDYRGVPVVGAACWLPQFGFGVATQIDAEEAFRPLHILQWIFMILVLLLLLCATTLFVVANLTWRRRLNAAELKLKQLGQYTLEEKIGAGGMGVVYRARHALLRRDTAVKLLLPERADPAAIARFEREVCLTCQLTHPNTIQVFDYGHTPDGIFYYAMEFLRGLNLHDLIAQYGPLPEGRVVHILNQICDSLAEAHALGLIHRDIKPGNIFLCHRGGLPDYVKVLDFGLVRQYRTSTPAEADAGEADVIEGTPWFTPPEAIRYGAQTDPRSDLYSLGALGYYLLTGQYIFEAETIPEIHAKQLEEAPIPPTHRTGQPISSEMEALLLRCLEKDANLRPQSAGELQALLLATPAATEWTLAARREWWINHEGQPLPLAAETAAESASPLATVSIDLASRID